MLLLISIAIEGEISEAVIFNTLGLRPSKPVALEDSSCLYKLKLAPML